MADQANESITIEVPPADDSPEAGIEALRQQMQAATDRAAVAEAQRDDERRSRESERQAREEAERRARDASSEAATTRRSAADAQYDSVINALAAAQGELVNIKGAYKTAMAEGDFDKAADYAAEIGMTAARVREFESGKVAIEQRRAQGDAVPPQQTGDPKENYIRTMPPRTAAWLRRNDRFFTDGNFQRMVQGAHGLAIGRGIEPESDAYFQYIEEQTGLRQAGIEMPVTPVSAAAATTARSSPVPSAPAAGSTAAVTRPSASGGPVTLSPEERDYCRRDGISEAAYAAQKAQLMAEGMIHVGH